MKTATKTTLCGVAVAVASADAFAPPPAGGVATPRAAATSPTALRWFGGGSGAKDLDEEVRRRAARKRRGARSGGRVRRRDSRIQSSLAFPRRRRPVGEAAGAAQAAPGVSGRAREVLQIGACVRPGLRTAGRRRKTSPPSRPLTPPGVRRRARIPRRRFQVEDRRIKATEEQIDKWAWQTKVSGVTGRRARPEGAGAAARDDHTHASPAAIA